ncbi:MAG: lipase maturation factor family protein [Coleofasciculaceae cyanobacterium]
MIAIISLWHQVLPSAGSRGIRPVKFLLKKIGRDYPDWQRFFYFPSLLWLSAEDWFLQGLVVGGVCSSLVVIFGGDYSGFALLICWLVYLSLDIAIGLAYPWDSLLLEAGFLALFLPSIPALPQLEVTSLPLASVTWAYHWLIFRLMLGFGKYKFWDSSLRDLAYLKGFFINQPMPTYFGWYAFRLPLWLLKFSLGLMFLVEVPIPFLVFVPGEARVFAAVAIALLMVAIQLTGNYGFFNILVIVLCLTLLDVNASIFNQGLIELVYPWQNLLTNAVVLILFIGGLLYFPFNSWCSQTWLYWPSTLKIDNPWLVKLLNFYRALAPFRLLHAYGVFPPHSSPGIRLVPIVEGTEDGRVWQEYHYRYMTSTESSPPRFVAPFHPRLDHGVFYEAFGQSNNFLCSLAGPCNPYVFSHISWLDCLIQRLLMGDSVVASLFGHNPFPSSSRPPVAIRVNLYMYQPTTPEEQARTGKWWVRTLIGEHLPPTSLDREALRQLLPDPELFHWDALIWKRRSRELNSLINLACTCGDAEPAFVTNSAGFPLDVDLFWSDFITSIDLEERQDWQNLPGVVERVRSRYSQSQLRDFEKILARLSLMLSARLEPYFFGKEEPQINLSSYFHLGMLIQHIIGQGRDAYEATLRNPAIAAAQAEIMTNETGLFYLGLFRYETMVFHARKFRLLQRISTIESVEGLPGFWQLIPFLSQQFESEDESLPTFIQSADGEWRVVE